MLAFWQIFKTVDCMLKERYKANLIVIDEFI